GEAYPNGTNGWVTVTFPLNEFRDSDGNGNILSDISNINSSLTERALTSGWNGGKVNMYVDNVRFQKK
ncbi:MAG: glycan-binding surface protein, partial [Dysgonomonas sp.]